jgi:hypothetical protein
LRKEKGEEGEEEEEAMNDCIINALNRIDCLKTLVNYEKEQQVYLPMD